MLRTAMAVLFGFMSLVHGPVMTFAKAGPPSAHHGGVPASHPAATSHAAHHQHHALPDEQPASDESGSRPACYAFGCFIAIDTTPVRAPAVILFYVGSISPAPADVMLAGAIEPAVPPPRLSV